MSLSAMAWTALSAYIVLVLVLGWVGMRRTASTADFAVAGRRMGPVIMALCFAGTFGSAATFMGYPGLFYAYGWPGLWNGAGFACGCIAAMLLTAVPLKYQTDKLNSLSIPDFVGDRYQSDFLRALTAIIVPIIYMAVMVAQYKGVGTLFQITLGVDYRYGVLLSALVVTIYTSMGGTIADIYTDAVQTTIMTVIILVVAFWGLVRLGGLQGIDAGLVAQDPKLVNWWAGPLFTPFGVFSLWLMHVFHVGSQPYIVKPYLSIRDRKMVGSFLLMAAILLLLQNFVGLTGVYGRVLLGPGLKNADAAFPQVIAQFFPPIVSVFVLIAILSAAMSTVDGLLVTISTCFSNDLYAKTIARRKGLADSDPEVNRKAIWVGRIGSWVCGLLPAYFAATNPPPFLMVMLWFGLAAVGALLAGPVVVGVYFRRGTPIAALVSMITGLGTYVLMYFVFRLGTNVSGAVGGLIGSATMILLSYATKQTLSDEFLDVLFPKRTAETSS